MKRYPAQQIVDEGIYFDPRRRKLASIAERGRLPGGKEASYLRVPTPILLVVGLVLSLAFVVFLPLIGFVMLARVLFDKARPAIRQALHATLEGSWPHRHRHAT